MRTRLLSMLHAWLIQNSPDILINLQQEYKVSDYLADRVNSISEFLNDLLQTGHPDYIIEEQCMNALTEQLLPSRFNYLSELIEEEFPVEFEQWKRNGILTYELCNLVTHCNSAFELYAFSEETADDRDLYYTITGLVSTYLETAAAEEAA